MLVFRRFTTCPSLFSHIHHSSHSIMAEETSNMEPDFPKLITNLSTISQAIRCLNDTIIANGTTPFLSAALAETRQCLDKASNMASQALDRSNDLKQQQVSIETLTEDLQIAKAALDEKTRLHTDEVQNHQKYVADLEKRHTETSSGFEARLRHAASEVERLRDDASEVNRLRGIESEFKRLQDVTSEVKKNLEEAKLDNVKLGEEIAQNNAGFDYAKQQLQEDVARRQGTIKTLNKKIVEINTKHNGEIGRTRGELDLAKTQLQAATNEVSIKKSQLDLAKTQLEAATSEVNAKTAQLAEVNVEHEETTKELGMKTVQLGVVNVQLEAATSEVNAKTAQLAEVNVQLEAATSEVNPA
jgi:chromosome segregation ATPase